MHAFGGFSMHIDFASEGESNALDLAFPASAGAGAVHRLPRELGRGTLELVPLGDRIAYAHGRCRGAPSEARTRITPAETCFQFVFHLAPTPIQLHIAESDKPLHLMRSDSLLLGPTVCGTLTLAPETPVDEIAIFADAKLIESCFADAQCRMPKAVSLALLDSHADPLLHMGNVTAALGLALRQLLCCGMNGGIARVYLEAKATEIVTLRLAQLNGGMVEPRPPRLLRGDLEVLEYARHILMTEYSNPPTIGELALAVGINRTKLKAGFRKQFGTTVFAFLRSQRMQHALQLLRDGNCNVSEAAALVGYNSLSAFCAAFKTEFGFSPRSVRGDQDGNGGAPRKRKSTATQSNPREGRYEA